MSEPISFRGYLHNWTLGEPPRLELVSLQADNAVALSIALLKGRELSLAIYWKEELVCTVAAALPPISTVVGKFSKCVKIKLDVYPNDAAALLTAIRYSEADTPMRFEVAPGGTLPEKPKREPKPKEPVSPNGRLWHELDKAGFHNRPDVRVWLAVPADDSEDGAKDAIRTFFGVKSRRDVPSEKLLAKLREYNEQGQLDGAITFVESVIARNQ